MCFNEKLTFKSVYCIYDHELSKKLVLIFVLINLEIES